MKVLWNWPQKSEVEAQPVEPDQLDETDISSEVLPEYYLDQVQVDATIFFFFAEVATK